MTSDNKDNSPRVARRRAQIRQHILDTARSLFAQRSIDTVTLTDITEAADISRGNLYSHFNSKQALIGAICQPAVTYMTEQMTRIEGAASPEALELYLRLHAEVWRKFPGVLLILQQLKDEAVMADNQAQLGELTRGHPQQMTTLFESLAAQGILKVDPGLSVAVVDTIAIPLLKLAQAAPNPDDYFVDGMLTLLTQADDTMTPKKQSTKAGYSGSPLVKKLGIKAGFKVYVKNPPTDYVALVAPLPDDVKLLQRLSSGIDMIHFFTKSRRALERQIPRFISKIKTVLRHWTSH